MQVKNKPRDEDSEHAFILGSLDCTYSCKQYLSSNSGLDQQTIFLFYCLGSLFLLSALISTVDNKDTQVKWSLKFCRVAYPHTTDI